MDKKEKLQAKVAKVHALMAELQIDYAAKLRFDENGWVPQIAYYDNEKYMEEEVLPTEEAVEEVAPVVAEEVVS
jgi:hypothetical protein